ncbi:MAG: diaminopimelate epimerase [Ilumatobacter fluminis]|uniref:diaminopimelate epimerase n=1 Tax=Ilumatobacter fluminis TaxID=467091 RepID=UPI0032EC7B9F
MSTLTITKHHGLGNDFLVVFHPDVPETDLPDLARRLCDRRRGLGADGLLVAESEDGYAARMVLYNADGSRAEMSGNGIRCFAQALAARRGDLDDQHILTDAGARLVTLATTDDADTVLATVEMGSVDPIAEPSGWAELGCHPDRPVAHYSLGNPHSVVGVDDVDVVDLQQLGSTVPHVNLEIVEPGEHTDEIRMRVHERGAGITEACGTGACASAVAAASWGLATPREGKLVVHMDGGSATVALDTPDAGRVTLTGPATFVATIEVTA